MTREEATKWLKTFKGRTGMAELSQAFDVAIKALEQEPQTDEIILSKKEYRELLSNEFEHGYDKGLSDAIKSLEQEPCEDCVNRQTVLNTLFYKSDNNCEVVLNKELQDRIKALPSVTPQQKIGYWTRRLIINEYGGCIGAKMICSECGQDNGYDKRMKFCPNCGAKMEVGE